MTTVQPDISSKITAYQTKLADYKKAQADYSASLTAGTRTFVNKLDYSIDGTPISSSTLQDVAACNSACVAAPSCKGATFTSSTKNCQTVSSDVTLNSLGKSIGNYAIIPDSLDKLLTVQQLNNDLTKMLVEIKTAIMAGEPSYDTNNTVRNTQKETLTKKYNTLLDERKVIDAEIANFRDAEDKQKSSGLIVNKNYYTYLGLTIVAVIILILLIYIVVSSSSPSSSSSSSSMMSSIQRGGKLNNKPYFFVFGVIIVSSLFFQTNKY